ncbi:FAD-dependent monooxygenase [Paenibacillus zeisoli]|uniref:FAD-dependent monooxygenase n=1 Tax=Paenibacillus zeisoli TaxID=2496267 RepID=A0A433XHT5_9BACL|nr:FAD-dependent monooxygenase [Paenibacillus zeisoli]RUT33622.1 FAD-dependent monooxygenase [Paenibacillus zeisoli]
MTNSLSVAIIGGGLGGLALAQSLKKNQIDFHVYEREQADHFTQTGYRIKINKNGTSALRFCLPEHLYELHIATSVLSPAHPDFIDAISLEVVKPRTSTPGVPVESGPSVNRFTFREVLLGELGDRVSFGYRFTHYETLQDGRLRAWFDNGQHVDADVLVGADGGASKVRRQYKPGVEVFDTGARVIFTKVFLDDKIRKELNLITGLGMKGVRRSQGDAPVTLLLEDMIFNPHIEKLPESMSLDVTISPQQDYLYAVFAGSPEWFGIADEQLFKMDGSALLSLAHNRTRHWHPQIRRMLELADPEKTAAYHLRNVLPYKPWKETTSLVLLGDALHPMTPVGVGGNAALLDACELSKELITVKNGEKQLLAALRDYEVNAIERGMRDVRLSSQGGASMFNQKPLPEEDMVIED